MVDKKIPTKKVKTMIAGEEVTIDAVTNHGFISTPIEDMDDEYKEAVRDVPHGSPTGKTVGEICGLKPEEKEEEEEEEKSEEDAPEEKPAEPEMPKKLSEKEAEDLTKDEQVAILEKLGAETIPRYEKDRVALILKLQ